MITKPTVIITSLGRTGTKFYADLFRALIPDGSSHHEPDVFNIVQYASTGERIREISEQLRESGVFNMTIRKALGRWGLIKLSDARVQGKLSDTEARQHMLKQREAFVRSRPGSVYIESSVAFYGLIDVANQVFRHHRVAYIIRDGRDWVRSNMDWGQMYGKGRMRRLVAHTWPAAPSIKDDPHQARWASMSRFERLCWAWSKLNTYALETIQRNPHARVFRFEDVFIVKERVEHLVDLLRFVTSFQDLTAIPMRSLDAWLEKPIHRGSHQFPCWQEWSAREKEQFQCHCDPLMKRLNYA